MAHLALSLFGSYRLTLDRKPIETIESDKARALLAYLAIEKDHPHPREKLVGIFWPEQDEAHARGSFSQALYHLRGILGDRPLAGALPSTANTQTREPCLLVTPQDIQLNPNADFETDVDTFSVLISACKAHTHRAHDLCQECLERHQKAIRVYRGDFLDGFYLPKSLAFEEWATVLREQFRLEVMDVLDRLVQVFERQGELEQALSYARKMVKLDELSEEGNLHVMRLLALLDRKAEAIAQYDAFRQTSAVQLGAEPGLEARWLYQCLRDEGTGASLEHLPTDLTPFIGRKQELSELWGWLCGPGRRLINIMGPGGSGKSRLALEVARQQRYHFRDGVYFVPLSALGSASSLLAAIADGLGFTFRAAGDHKHQLMDYLRNKKILLILDSFETMGASSGLLAEILSASEGSKALVTSRVQLNLSIENVYSLAGMEYPPPGAKGDLLDYSSVELFQQAAQRVKPEYLLDDPDGVGRVCRLVQGMPLGLLLASSWVGVYPVREIADQVERSLDFLSVEWADLPERQRSLRATFEYSWNLLSPDEQRILMSLVVFRNPFTPQAALQVAGARPQQLHTLHGKSLLISIAEGYFQMHDLVRQFSEEKLATSPEGLDKTIHQKHSDYFLERAAWWNKVFKGPQQADTLIQADKEIEDVRAAWEWAARQMDQERLWRASEGLLMYFNLRYRFQEGEHACQVAIENLKKSPMREEWLNLEGWLLVWQALFFRTMGKVESAWQLLEASLNKLRRAESTGQDIRQGQALLWRENGNLAGSLPEQIDYHLLSASIYQDLCDPWWQALELAWAGELVNRLGDNLRSKKLLEKAVALSQEAGEPRRLAYCLSILAYYQLIYEKWEIGFELMKEAAYLSMSIGDMSSQATCELLLGVSLGWTGRKQEASDLLEIALAKLHQLGDRFNITYGTLGLGIIHLHSGKYEEAKLSLQECFRSARENGYRREEAHGLAEIGCLKLVQGPYEKALENIQQSVDSFRKMGFAGELSMALGGLTLAQHLLGNDQQAWSSLREALYIAADTHSRFTMFTLPVALLVLLVDAGRWEQAVEAYTAVMTDPIVATSVWFADMVGDRLEHAKDLLPEDSYLAAEERGREGDVFDVLARLLKEINSM